jgi:peptidoglycan/xylan/chitin deacetylase (PgdA/CDA1 family)
VKALLVAALLCVAAPARAVEIALTFDDLPAHSALPPGETRVSVAKATLDALKDTPVHGFVNGAFMEAEPGSEAVLAMWRAAGHPLGNHTWSHMDLNAKPAADFEADLIRDEALLAGEARWLRYPYLNEGDSPAKRAGVRAFLAGRGYRIATVTLSFDDYAWNAPYARCAAKGDQAAVAELERRYLAAADVSLDRARAMSQALEGRDIPYILLMHIGAFDARMLPRLLALYREKGVTFVGLEAAMRDPFYAADFTAAPSPAPATLEEAMKAKSLVPPAKGWSFADLDALCR